MSNSLSLTNFNHNNILAQTTLTADIAAGVNALAVANNAGFTSSGYIIVGDLGSPTSEKLIMGSPSGNTTIPTTANTTLAHDFGDTVTLLFGNQLNVYRADDVYGNGSQPPDADFSKIDTIDIVANATLTPYTDAIGTPGQWYKFTYYNATTQTETLLADSRAVQLGVIHYVSLDQVRDAAGFTNNPNVTDDIVAEKRDAAEREVNGALQSVYALPFPQPTNPIIVNIVKNIAGGELMAEMYTGVSATKVAEGNAKAAKGRIGSDEDDVAGIAQLVERIVVLQDANYLDLTNRQTSGVSGYPDATVRGFATRRNGGGSQIFWPGMRY